MGNRLFDNVNLGLENEDDPVDELETLEPAEEVEAADTDEMSVSPETTEVAEEVAEGQDDDALISEATAGLESLEDVCVKLQSIPDGIGQESADLLVTATSNTFKSLGYELDEVSPSMESFGGSNTQAMATSITCESWKEAVSKGWNQLKEFLMNMLKRIKDAALNLFDSARRLESSVAKARKIVEAYKDSEQISAKFENRGLVSIFGHGISEAKAKSVCSVLDNHNKLASIPVDTSNELMTFMKDLSEAQKEIDKSKDAESAGKVSDDIDKQADKFTGATKKLVEKLGKNTSVDGSSRVVSMLTRGRKVIFHFSDNGVENIDFIKVEVISNKPSGTGVMGTASIKEMGEVLDKAEALAKTSSETRKKIASEIKAFEKQGVKIINDAIKAAGDQDKKSVLVKQRRAVTGATRAFNSLFKVIPGLSVNAGEAGVAYVYASLKQYKKPEKKKD